MTADTIKANYVREFSDKFALDVQQKQSRLERGVTNHGRIVGADFTINKFGTVEMQDKTVRLKETDLTLIPTSARIVTMRDKILATAIDATDETKMKADLRGPIRNTFFGAVNRTKDDIIYNALLGDIASKTTYSDSGIAQVSLPASQKITLTTGVTSGMFTQILSMFMGNEVGVEDGEEIYITYNAATMKAILDNETLTNADYTAVKMLWEGNISGKWLGMNWIPYNRMKVGSTEGTRVGVAWAKSGIEYGWNVPQDFRIDVRPDLEYATQFGGIYSFGAGRNDEKKVVAFEFLSA